jgi:hypothetical protein
LDQDFVAATKDLLDGRLEPGAPAAQLVASTRSSAITTWFAATFVGVIVVVFVSVFILVLIVVVTIGAVVVIGTWIVSVHDFVRIVSCLTKVLRLDIADMEETISADSEVDEGSLDAGFDIDDFAFIDISNPIVLAGPFCVEFFENTVFQQCDSAFLRLGDIDEHFLLHRTGLFLFMVTILVGWDAIGLSERSTLGMVIIVLCL